MYLPYQSVVGALIDGSYEREHGKDITDHVVRDIWCHAIPDYQEKLNDCDVLIEYHADDPIEEVKYRDMRLMISVMIDALENAYPRPTK